jgi:hypothetical protein
MRLPAAVVAAVLGFAVPVGAMLGWTSFPKLAVGSDDVVVGRVARLVDVPAGETGSVKIAEVEVEVRLRGEASADRIFYLATATDEEDCTTALPGERGLFFLVRPKGEVRCLDEDVEARLRDPSFQKNAKAVTGGAPLLLLSWAGHGRMPIESVGGTEYATLCREHVRLPTDLDTIPGPDPRFTDWDRRARLDDLLDTVRRHQAPAAAPGGVTPASVLALLAALDADPDHCPAEADEPLLQGAGDEAEPALFALLDDPECPRRDTVAEALLWTASVSPGALLDGLRSASPVRRRAAA